MSDRIRAEVGLGGTRTRVYIKLNAINTFSVSSVTRLTMTKGRPTRWIGQHDNGDALLLRIWNGERDGVTIGPRLYTGRLASYEPGVFNSCWWNRNWSVRNWGLDDRWLSIGHWVR